MRTGKQWFALAVVVVVCGAAVGHYGGGLFRRARGGPASHRLIRRAPKRLIARNGRKYVRVDLPKTWTPDKSTVTQFLDAYVARDPGAMSALAADGAKYSDLTAHGMPRNIVLYVFMQAIPADRCSECAGNTNSGSEHYHVCANDDNGLTRRFTIRLSGGRVSSVSPEPDDEPLVSPAPNDVPPDTPSATPLSSSERLQIIERYVTGIDPGTVYLDFGRSRNYEDYVEVDANNSADETVSTFWHKENGQWKYLTETRDKVPFEKLNKLRVPEDVRKVVWGEHVGAKPIKTIYDAVMQSNLTEVKRFIQQDPELVNARDEYGRTPLHVALSADVEPASREAAVKLLLGYGADVNAETGNGKTPLTFAKSLPDWEQSSENQSTHRDSGKAQLIGFLIANGAY